VSEMEVSNGTERWEVRLLWWNQGNCR
jgi:hypothetical protein